jgi:hypothetical protein
MLCTAEMSPPWTNLSGQFVIVGNKLFNHLVRPRAQIQFHSKGRIIYHVHEQTMLPRLAEREKSHNQGLQVRDSTNCEII